MSFSRSHYQPGNHPMMAKTGWLSLHTGYFFMILLLSADFFRINFFKNFYQEHYESVKWFGPGNRPMFCLS